MSFIVRVSEFLDRAKRRTKSWRNARCDDTVLPIGVGFAAAFAFGLTYDPNSWLWRYLYWGPAPPADRIVAGLTTNIEALIPILLVLMAASAVTAVFDRRSLSRQLIAPVQSGITALCGLAAGFVFGLALRSSMFGGGDADPRGIMLLMFVYAIGGAVSLMAASIVGAFLVRIFKREIGRR